MQLRSRTAPVDLTARDGALGWGSGVRVLDDGFDVNRAAVAADVEIVRSLAAAQPKLSPPLAGHCWKLISSHSPWPTSAM